MDVLLLAARPVWGWEHEQNKVMAAALHLERFLILAFLLGISWRTRSTLVRSAQNRELLKCQKARHVRLSVNLLVRQAQFLTCILSI